MPPASTSTFKRTLEFFATVKGMLLLIVFLIGNALLIHSVPGSQTLLSYHILSPALGDWVPHTLNRFSSTQVYAKINSAWTNLGEVGDAQRTHPPPTQADGTYAWAMHHRGTFSRGLWSPVTERTYEVVEVTNVGNFVYLPASPALVAEIKKVHLEYLASIGQPAPPPSAFTGTFPGRYRHDRIRWPFVFNDLLVLAAFVLLARGILLDIRDLRGARRLRKGLCPRCAYDVRAQGASQRACPECGHALPALAPTQ